MAYLIRLAGFSVNTGTKVVTVTSDDERLKKVLSGSSIQFDGVSARFPLSKFVSEVAGVTTLELAEEFDAVFGNQNNVKATVEVGEAALAEASENLNSTASYVASLFQVFDDYSSTVNIALEIPLLGGGTVTTKTIKYMEQMVDGFFDTPSFTGAASFAEYIKFASPTGTGLATERWIGSDGANSMYSNVPPGLNHFFGVNNITVLTLGESNMTVSTNVVINGDSLILGDGSGDKRVKSKSNQKYGFQAMNELDNGPCFGATAGVTPSAVISNNGGTTLVEFTDSGDWLPGANASQNIGSAPLQIDNIYAANSPTISDERQKMILGPASELVELMRRLDPVLFSYKDSVTPERKEKVTRQVTRKQTRDIPVIKLIDGVPVKQMVPEEYDEPVYELLGVVDGNGDPVFQNVQIGEDEQGNPIFERQQELYKKPVMEEVWVTIPENRVSHSRPHAGLKAQQVKLIMDELGINDFAGYAFDEANDLHLLRMLEFIAPLLAYLQDTEARVKKLEEELKGN